MTERGETINVRWFCSESNQEEVYETKVLAMSKSKKDGRYSYTLLFPDGEIRKTKNLEQKKCLKRKHEMSLIITSPPPLRFSLPPHRFILAPMVDFDRLILISLSAGRGI